MSLRRPDIRDDVLGANQQARQRSRLVGAGRWMSLGHENLMKLLYTGRAGGGRAGGAVPPSAC